MLRRRQRVAVVGAGISGMAAAYALAKAGAEVVVYEKEDYLGGHAKTVTVDGLDVDLGFMVFNRVTYPNMMELFESLGVEMERSDMSFSVSLDGGKGCEWGSRSGFSGLFAQKSNAFNPYFWRMLKEMIKFKEDVLKYLEEHENNPDLNRNETLEQFITSCGYSQLFQKAYLIPICACIWSCPSEGVMSFSAFSVLSFCRNHHLLQLLGRPQWLTIKCRSHSYVNKITEELENMGCQIKPSCAVESVVSIDGGCHVLGIDHSDETYDSCIICAHAPDALKILGTQATHEEIRILGAFQYVNSDIYLHYDKTLMPQNPSAWSAWNFLGTTKNGVCITYWLNVLQNLGSTTQPFLVTLNPPRVPNHTLLKWRTGHPVPSVAASKASLELNQIQGKRGIWFCGAYQGYGFHEDGLKAGLAAAYGVLGKECALLENPKHMVPSLTETGARFLVTRFLNRFISTGNLTLLEEGGTVFSFGQTDKKCSVNSVLRIHNPLFYWKIATEADLGLADAYIHGNFSFVDEQEGLQDLFLILIANRDLRSTSNNVIVKRGWWTPLLLTAGLASARYFFRHISRQNTVTQARRNISRHYDLSNDFFSLFLDDTMTYSSAIFKSANEDLKVAQLRKIHLLIEKARIDGKHEVLEIGCGWGSLALEVVKRTGCRYTGITLSKEQLKYATKIVREAGLQSSPRIRFNKEGTLLAVSTLDNGIKILANTDGIRLLRTFENRPFDPSRTVSEALSKPIVSPITAAAAAAAAAAAVGTSSGLADRAAPSMTITEMNGDTRNLVDVKPRIADESIDKSKIWKLTEISEPTKCRSLRLVDNLRTSKISRLIYTNSGVAILALAANAVHLLWKWPRNERNSTGKATANISPQLWQPPSGILMTNDVTDVTPEDSVPCFALSKNDSYVMSASGGKISLFNMMTFKTMTTFMPPPPAATFLAFHPQDNNIIAIGMDDSTIQIYNVRVDEVKSKLRGHTKRITGLAFSNVLNVLVSSGADAQICVWGTDGWEKQRSRFLQCPSGSTTTNNSDTRVQFHQDQIHFLAVHETQIAIYETTKLECVNHWFTRENTAPISHATFSCDSQLIYASLLDATVCIFSASSLKLRCRILPAAYLPPNLSASVHPLVIAAHPSEPNQFALGLTDGGVHVLEPLESEGKWGVPPPAENSSTGSVPEPPPAGASTSDQPQR